MRPVTLTLRAIDVEVEPGIYTHYDFALLLPPAAHRAPKGRRPSTWCFSPRRQQLRHWSGVVWGAANGSFYEDVCQPPLNSDVQWSSDCLYPYASVMTLTYIIGRRCLLVADPSSCISEFKVGVSRGPSPLLGLTSIRAGTRPVTTYLIRAKRWVQTPVTNAPHLCGRSLASNPLPFRAR